MSPRIEVSQGVNGHWFWRLRASNGEVLSSSELYYSKWNAQRAAKKLGKLTQFDIIETKI